MSTPNDVIDAIDGAVHSLNQLRHTLAGIPTAPGWQAAYLTELARLDGPLAAVGNLIETLSAEVSRADLPGSELAAGYLEDAASSVSDKARDEIDRARDSLIYATQ